MPSTSLLLIAFPFTVWRVSSLVYSEAHWLDWLRRRLGIIMTIEDDPSTWRYPENLAGRVLSCFWCISLWVSAVFCAVLTISSHTGIIESAILWPAGSAISIMIERYIGRSRARW